MDLFLQILYTVLLLGFLILAHEFGHFITAKLFKVQINEFSIGMGPQLIGVRGKKLSSIFIKKTEDHDTAEDEHKTMYSLRLLPIGGYVSMEGEDFDENNDNPDSFFAKPAWKRFIIIIAGALMNLIIALIFTLIITLNMRIPSTTVGGFTEGATSMDYGIQVGDTITQINGVNINTYSDFSYAFQSAMGQSSVDVTVLRDGKEIELKDVVFPMYYGTTGELVTEQSEAEYAQKGEDPMKIMLNDFAVYETPKTFSSVIKYTFQSMFSFVQTTYRTLADLVTGKLSFEYVSGPIGMSSSIKTAVQSGATTLMYFTALISINLAVINLLPLPALDGGRAFFILLEMITRRRLPSKIEGYIHAAGMAALMLLMVVVAFKDLFFPII